MAIRTPPAPHPIAFTSPFLPVPRKNIPIFPLDRENCLWYIYCTNTNSTLNTPKGGITRAAFGLSGQPSSPPAGAGRTAAADAQRGAAGGRPAPLRAQAGHGAGHQPQHHSAGHGPAGGGGLCIFRGRPGQLCTAHSTTASTAAGSSAIICAMVRSISCAAKSTSSVH